MTRKNNFDFIRLFAATLVIVGHAYPILGLSGGPMFAGVSVHSLAVKIFFALSGYLVVKSWQSDPHLLRFAAKRVLRLFPALIIVVVICATAVGPLVTDLPLNDYFGHQQFDQYFENTILKIRYPLPGVFTHNIYPSAVNGSLWSLPAEAFMYLIVAGVGIFASAIRGLPFRILWSISSLFILSLHIWVYVFGSDAFKDVVIYATSIMHVLDVAPYFMFGGIFALYRNSIPLRMDFAILALLFCNFSALPALSQFEVVQKLFPLFGITYAALAIGNGSLPLLRDVGKFGDMSYGVYLWGFPVAQTLSWWKGRDFSIETHILLTVLISWFLGYFSWHLIEKRALTYKKFLKPDAGRERQ